MEIRGLQGSQAISGLTSAAKSGRSGSAAETTASSFAPVDELDLSAEAQEISSAAGVSSTSETAASDGGIRTEKVAALRRSIAEGTYDTPERVSAALDRFLDEYA